MKAPPKKKSKRRGIGPKWWLAAGTLAVILLIAGSWFALRKNRATKDVGALTIAQNESKIRPSIAVLGFQNLSELPNTGLLGEMLADGLWSQLDTDEVRFIPPSRVDEMRNNLGIEVATGTLDRKQLEQIKEYLGSDVVITGTYRVKEDAGARKIDWNIHLLSADQDKGLGSLQTSGTEADLGVMVGRAGKMIRSKLGVELSVTEEARLDNSMSSNSEALKYFSEAREKRRRFDMQGSIKSLERALQADPNFAQAHLSLAEAWSALGYEAKAEEEAQKAMELSKDLPAIRNGS